MLRNPIDIASRVSPELSDFIEMVINNMETDEPITLGAIRTFISAGLPAEINETEEMHHFDVSESTIDELDALIAGFGVSAAAFDFVYAFASEPLSRVIEEVINEENRENPATLAAVKDEIVNGLSGRLVGEGILEEDEDDLLMPEIEELIYRFGADAPAETFLRYE